MDGKLSLQLGPYSPRKWANPPLERSTVDRPDEAAGKQIHPIYVLPSDGVDHNYDANGVLRELIANSQDWLAGAGTDRLSYRYDTYDGQYDISFLQLPTDKETVAKSWNVWDGVWAGGYPKESNKIYLVFYDEQLYRDGKTAGTPLCGFADGTPGNIAVVNLYDNRCGVLPSDINSFSYHYKTVVHEVGHGLGAVPLSAPHSDGNQHSTDLADIMAWKNPPSISEVETMQFDPGHDDYWQLAEDDWLLRNHFYINIDIRGGGQVSADQQPNRYLGSPESNCSDDCVMWFGRGALVGFTASPENPSWRFKGWENSQSDQKNRNTNTYGVMVDGDETLRVVFEPIVYLNVRVRGPGKVRVIGQRVCAKTCEYELQPGGNVNILAIPAKDARIARWLGPCAATRNINRCTLPLRHEVDINLQL